MRAYGWNQITKNNQAVTRNLLPVVALSRGGEQHGRRNRGSWSLRISLKNWCRLTTCLRHVKTNYALFTIQICIHIYTHTRCLNLQLWHQSLGVGQRKPPLVQVLPSPIPLCPISAPALLSAAATRPERNQREKFISPAGIWRVNECQTTW